MKPNWRFIRRRHHHHPRRRRRRRRGCRDKSDDASRSNAVVKSDSFTIEFHPERRNGNAASAAAAAAATVTVAESGIGGQFAAISEQVRYIYAVPVRRRPTSLWMLQKPLRRIYLAYMSNRYASVPAIVDVTARGLRCQHAKSDGSDVVDIFNEFETIAYWAAVQCVVRVVNDNDNDNDDNDDVDNDGKAKSGLCLRFLPFAEDGLHLVDDIEPCTDDRDDDFDDDESLTVDEGLTRLKLDERNRTQLLHAEHQPFFACVMRPTDRHTTNTLQCHIFLCNDARQAVSLASALYSSLLAHMCRFRHPIPVTQLQIRQRRPQLDVTAGTEPHWHRKLSEKRKSNSAHLSRSFSQFLVSLRRLFVGRENRSLSTNDGAKTSKSLTESNSSTPIVHDDDGDDDDDDDDHVIDDNRRTAFVFGHGASERQKRRCPTCDMRRPKQELEHYKRRNRNGTSGKWHRLFLQLYHHRKPKLQETFYECTNVPTAQPNAGQWRMLNSRVLSSRLSEMAIKNLQKERQTGDAELHSDSKSTNMNIEMYTSTEEAYYHVVESDKSRTEKETTDCNSDNTLKTFQKTDEMMCCKKDAEIMSIIEQLGQSHSMSIAERITNEATGGWGSSAFLP